MSSTTYFNWTKPIALKSSTLNAFEDVAKRYGVVARRAVVTRDGENPDQIQTSDDAKKLEEETGRFKYEWLAKTIKDAESISWSVSMINGIHRTGLSIDEVLALPNAGASTITDLECVVGAHGCRLEIHFSDDTSRSARISLLGDYSDVQMYKSEIEQVLEANSRNWSIVKRPWVGILGVIASYFIGAALVLGTVLKIGILRSWSAENGASNLFTTFLIWSFLFAVFVNPVHNRIAKIFPFVEFQINGGVNSAEARRLWRRAAWSIPVLVIAFPVLTNWLYDFIF